MSLGPLRFSSYPKRQLYSTVVVSVNGVFGHGVYKHHRSTETRSPLGIGNTETTGAMSIGRRSSDVSSGMPLVGWAECEDSSEEAR